MQFRFISLLLVSMSVLFAQQIPRTLVVRSLRVKLISTSTEPLRPIEIDAITKAFKSSGVALEVEKRLDPAELEKASDVIRKMYGAAGRNVRVEHSVTSIPPGSVEVAFDVVELCRCE